MSGSDDEYDPLEVTVSSSCDVRSTEKSLVPSSATRWTNSTRSEIAVKSAEGERAVLPSTAAPPGAPTLVTRETEGTGEPQTVGGSGANTGIIAGGIRLHGIKGRVRSICLSPDGSILCAGGEDGQLCMWDFNRPPESRRVDPTRVLTPFVNRIAGYQAIISVHASTDGSYFCVCQEGDRPALVAHGGAQLGYCAMGERGLMDVVRCKGHRAPVTSSSPSATDAKKFFTCSQDGTARMWDSETFTFSSQYAVKHGSGQLDENFVVESVCGLSAAVGGGQCFITGGQDGCLQLWDARVKYRPGGAVGMWSPFNVARAASSTVMMMPDAEEYHIGGLAELLEGPPIVAARIGEDIHVLDLRVTVSASIGRNSTPTSSTLRKPPVSTVRTEKLDWVPPLPFVTDTTPIVRGTSPRSLLTGTSHTGFRHVVGGHVATLVAVGDTQMVKGEVDGWTAGRPDEDVLCVAADYIGGAVFAGLSTGDVVVRPRSVTPLVDTSCAFFRWWDSRPSSVHHQQNTNGDNGKNLPATTATNRQVGQKSFRIEDDLLF